MSTGTVDLNETTTWRSAGCCVSADTMFVARVPIYGTCDAGRGFWKKLRHDILSTGLKENAVIRALYIYQEDGELKLMLATHVDDMLWASKSGYEDRVQQLLDRYTIKTVESGTFRFCGREVIQHSDFSVSVKCKEEAKESSHRTTDCSSKADFSLGTKMEMLTITDASFGNESNFRSQKRRMTFLTGPDSFDKKRYGSTSDWLFFDDHR